MDYHTAAQLRRHHPAWKLLQAQHAPLTISFLDEVFIQPNERSLSESHLQARLEDRLFNLRETEGEDAFPQTASHYLNDWADNDKGWLRKFYPANSDEAHFDLLQQMLEGVETDKQTRLNDLQRRKAEIEDEIFGERDAIADSDQGRTFRAFWDFLMSPTRQQQLTEGLVSDCDEHQRQQRRLEQQQSILTEQRGERDRLRQAIGEHGGDRIEQLKSDIARRQRRYGFAEKPATVRLRILDPAHSLNGLTDLQTPVEQFNTLALAVRTVFIIENDITALAFPPVPNAIVIFGQGYGVDRLLGGADWLQDKPVYYWGDIDTHGFAILNQLRSVLPHSRSLLMDAATLNTHQWLMGTEPKPTHHQLPNLTEAEQALYHALRNGDYGEQPRLEQERIPLSALPERFPDPL